MVYEYRRYEAAVGKFPALLDRFEDATLALFEKHGMQPIGFWQADVGTTNELNYILRWENQNQRAESWSALVADPDWADAKARTEVDGPLAARIHNQLWLPTRFSPRP